MLSGIEFKRLFSLSMRKERGFSFSKMSFSKDFINDRRGNLYPVLDSLGEFSESVENGKYRFSGIGDAFSVRLLGRHHHYATYELRAKKIGKCGFSFRAPDSVINVIFSNKQGKLTVECGEKLVCTEIEAASAESLIVTSRKAAFDAYIEVEGYKKLVASFDAPDFPDSDRLALRDTVVGVFVGGEALLTEVSSYMDTGVSIADIRPMRYENGDVIIEGGKIFLTASVREEVGAYQGVFSWVPGTCDFELIGALFFDVGDGYLGDDVASSIIYDRASGLWRLYVASFSHGHILAYSEFDADPRFGENYLDVTLMEKMQEADSDEMWLGKEGDEDPDLIYDAERKIWRMVICRKSSEDGKYRYFYFESKRPDGGFCHVAHSKSGEETGGSLLFFGRKYYLCCGNGFNLTANYRLYELPDMESYKELSCDYNDGGFRGWGTVIPIKRGTRKILYWLTFDRHLGSEYNWSYGNLYCFASELEYKRKM